MISADAVPAAQRSKNEAPGASPDHYPQVLRWTRASGTTGGKGEVPSLAKEGTPRHQVNGPVPLEARPGWFVQLPIIGGLNQPPRLCPLRRLRAIFLMGAATPPCPRRGLRLSLQLFSMPPCPAKDVGHGKGASPGYRNQQTLSPEGAKDSAATLSPLPGLGSTLTRTPGLRPGLRSYAAPRQKRPDPHCASFFQGV